MKPAKFIKKKSSKKTQGDKAMPDLPMGGTKGNFRELKLEDIIKSISKNGYIKVGYAIFREDLDLRHINLSQHTGGDRTLPIGIQFHRCLILGELRLDNVRLSYLKLFGSALRHLSAKNAEIDGDVDLGYVFSSEDCRAITDSSSPENDGLEDTAWQPQFFIDAFEKAYLGAEKKKTGTSASSQWWHHFREQSQSKDDVQNSGQCSVDLSNATINGTLLLDGCRLAAPAIKKPENSSSTESISPTPSIPALSITHARIHGDVLISAVGRNPKLRVRSPQPGAFLGEFRGKSLNLSGDFLCSGALIQGYKDIALYLQGASIDGAVVLSDEVEIEEDVSGQAEHYNTQICGCIDFSSTKIGSHFIISHAKIFPVEYCLKGNLPSEPPSVYNVDKALIRLNAVKIHGDANIKLSNSESEIFAPGSSFLISLSKSRIDGDISISSNNHPRLMANLRYTHCGGNFRVRGIFTGEFIANAMQIGGELDLDETIFQKSARLDFCQVGSSFKMSGRIESEFIANGMKVGGDVEFFPTLCMAKADLTAIHVGGNLNLSPSIERASVQEKAHRVLTFKVPGRNFEPKKFAEDRKQLLESQTKEDDFNQIALDQAPAQLILKHAIVEHALRVHRIDVDLGRYDRSEHVDLYARLVEFMYRKPLRFCRRQHDRLLLRLLLSPLRGWSERRLEESYGNELFGDIHNTSDSQFKFQILSSREKLSFYPNHDWLRILVEDRDSKAKGRKCRGGIVDCVFNTYDRSLTIIGGDSSSIYQLNSSPNAGLKLENDEQIADYARFFCECAWGEEGPFHILEPLNKHQVQQPEDRFSQFRKLLEIVVPAEADKLSEEERLPTTLRQWQTRVNILYAGDVFEVDLIINSSGDLDMKNSKLVSEVDAPNPLFLKPYRCSSGEGQITDCIFPMQIPFRESWIDFDHYFSEAGSNLRNSLIGFANRHQPPVMGRLADTGGKKTPAQIFSAFTKWLSGLFASGADFPFSGWGSFRRFLDRWGLNKPEKLPVIDLRSAHAEVLNDRRGSGWRDPLQTNPDWFNYKILLRLEGFTYNRLIYPLESSSPRAGLTLEFQRAQDLVDSAPIGHNDQNWKSRMAWLYRQYPSGTPTRINFHQQPFSQAAKAYRIRGDSINYNKIIQEKISIELKLLRQRLVPSGITVFSWFTLVAFTVLLLLSKFSAVGSTELNSVLFAVANGAIGVLIFRHKKDNILSLLIPSAVLLLSLLTQLAWKTELSDLLAARPEILLLMTVFLGVIVVFGCFGRLILKFLHDLYAICFGYGLSPWRALSTMIAGLIIGTLWVGLALENNILILDAEYSAVAFDSSSADPGPGFVRAENYIGPPLCDGVIDPFMYAADIFIPLIDFRQEFRCHVRGEVGYLYEYSDSEESLVPVQQAGLNLRELAMLPHWKARFEAFLGQLSGNPQVWLWTKGLYTILGWVIISLLILTITRNVRIQFGENPESIT